MTSVKSSGNGIGDLKMIWKFDVGIVNAIKCMMRNREAGKRYHMFLSVYILIARIV